MLLGSDLLAQAGLAQGPTELSFFQIDIKKPRLETDEVFLF
jgi:hypothetical protein